MFVRNLKLALVVIIGGVVFGLIFSYPSKVWAGNYVDVQVEPSLSTAGTPIRFRGSPAVAVGSFSFSVVGNIETDKGSFGLRFFSEENIPAVNNLLDYSYSGLIGKGPYLYTPGDESLIPDDIKEGKPLPISQNQESNLFWVDIKAYYQDKDKPVAIGNPLTSFTIYRLPYQPVLFIHGLGGKPDDWQTGNRNYFQFLEENGYPSTHLLSYGYAGRHRDSGGYNYDGAVEDISADMEQAIATLSAQSTDGKVDIVAYSLGNLIARYYLANHKNNHKVDQVISIAGPNKGSYWIDIDEAVKQKPYAGKYLEQWGSGLIISGLHAMGLWKTDQPFNTSSPAAQQLFSTSSFLAWLNIAVNTPSNVRFYPLYGDIHATFKRKLFHWEIKKEKDIGDGVILAESASEIAGANNPQKTAYKENSELVSKLVMNADGSWRVDWLGIDSMKYFHTRILEQQELKDKVKQILMSN